MGHHWLLGFISPWLTLHSDNNWIQKYGHYKKYDRHCCFFARAIKLLAKKVCLCSIQCRIIHPNKFGRTNFSPLLTMARRGTNWSKDRKYDSSSMDIYWETMVNLPLLLLHCPPLPLLHQPGCPPPIHLCFSLAGCCIALCCAASASASSEIDSKVILMGHEIVKLLWPSTGLV